MSSFLVTGGAGFIGSALVRELLQRGERVRVVDNFLTGHRRNLTDVSARIELFEADIRDLEQLRPAFVGVDYVLHHAAIASVPRSIEDPISTDRTNVQGTLNVLLAARDAGVKRVVYAASSSAYGNAQSLPQTETMPANPISPYAVSKFAGELYAKVFVEVYGLETVRVRYFNVFGPRQDPSSPYSGVLSLFIAALLRGTPPTIYGSGEQSRDFTFVDNAVEATLLACTAPGAAGKVCNVATGERYTINQTIALLRRIIGSDVNPVYAAPRPGDILHSQADITLARQLLGYDPKVSFEDGLARTVDWYRTSEKLLSSAPR